MEIYAISATGVRQTAYRIGGVYKCFPPSENENTHAQEFSTIQEAAIFLIQNPSWGIRMNPGSAIKYRDIQIAR